MRTELWDTHYFKISLFIEVNYNNFLEVNIGTHKAALNANTQNSICIVHVARVVAKGATMS